MSVNKMPQLGNDSDVQRLQLLAATVLAIAAAVVGRARLTQLVEAVLLLLVRGEVAARELVVVGGGGVALLVALRHARPAHLRVRLARLLQLDLLAGGQVADVVVHGRARDQRDAVRDLLPVLQLCETKRQTLDIVKGNHFNPNFHAPSNRHILRNFI